MSTNPERDAAAPATEDQSPQAAPPAEQFHEPAASEVDQAALARKVDALLGEQDDVEVLARSEEAKLEARTGGRGKAALEEAASRRLAEIGTKKVKTKSEASADTARRAAASSALSTPARLSEFVAKHRAALGAVLAASVLGLAALGGYAYAAEKAREEAGVELGQALTALDARIVTPEEAKAKRPEADPQDDGPTYGTASERAEAALTKLEAVEKHHPGTGAAFLAELTRASVLSSEGKYDEALAVFDAVRKTPLGRADLEVSLRAAEGIGIAHEGLAFRKPEKQREELDLAMAAYKELVDSNALGFAELGQYHTGRVHEQRGESDKAKEVYHALYTKLTKPAEDHPLGTYLEAVVTLRLQTVDPTFAPPRSPAMGGSSKVDEAQIKRLIEQMKKNPGKGGPVPAGEGH